MRRNRPSLRELRAVYVVSSQSFIQDFSSGYGRTFSARVKLVVERVYVDAVD